MWDLTAVFAAHGWTGAPENREPRKHAQVRWVDADATPENFADTTAGALHRHLTRGPAPRSRSTAGDSPLRRR